MLDFGEVGEEGADSSDGIGSDGEPFRSSMIAASLLQHECHRFATTHLGCAELGPS